MKALKIMQIAAILWAIAAVPIVYFGVIAVIGYGAMGGITDGRPVAVAFWIVFCGAPVLTAASLIGLAVLRLKKRDRTNTNMKLTVAMTVVTLLSAAATLIVAGIWR